MTRRKVAVTCGAVVVVVAALAAVAVLYLSSASFQQRAKAMVVERLEAITGGRVEMKEFHWNFGRMDLEVGDLTIHGRESAEEPPYIHADRVFADATITSLFGRKLSLRRLTIEHPTVQLTIGPQGITNQPTPRGGPGSAPPFFDVSIDRLEISDGRLLVNDRAVPFSVAAANVGASTEFVSGRYNGTLHATDVKASYGSVSPLKFRVDSTFAAWPNRLEIQSSRWSTDHSQIEAKGTVENFAHPRVDVTYNAAFDIAEVGNFLRIKRPLSGSVELNGHGVYSAQDIDSTGKLVIHNAEWHGDSFRAAGVNGGAQYTVSSDRVQFSHLFVTLFGGTVSGSSEVRNWKSIFDTKDPAKHPAVGVANLRCDALQLRDVAAILSSRALPLSKVAMAGRVSGTLETHWVRSIAAGDTDLKMDVTPPPRVNDGELPVTARLQATYRGGRELLEVAQLNVATRATRIDAAGVLGSSTANLRVAVNSTDISEFNPVLSAFGETAALAKLNGHASFNGTVAGRLRSPTVIGHVQINDFESLFTASVLGALPTNNRPQPVHWDELVADVSLSATRAEARRAVLRRGNAHIGFDGAATLQDWQFDKNSPLSIRAHLSDLGVVDLERFFARNDPVSGRVTMDLDLSGTLNNLDGGGHVQIADLKLGPEQFTSLAADLRFVGRESQWNNVVLRHDGAIITGSGAYHLDTGIFRFEAGGRSFDLSRVETVQTPKYKVSGFADFDISGSGTADAPIINGSLRVKSVVVNGEPVGDIAATAVTRGAQMEVKARAHVEEAALDITGTANLRGDWPIKLHVTTNDFDFDPILRAYLGNRITGHSSMAGSADITGPLRSPRNLRINGTIDRLSAEIEKLRFRNPEGSPIEFAMQEQVFTLKRSHLVAEDTDVITDGTIQLGGMREMNLRSKGNLSMKLLQVLNPELRASGSTVFDLMIGGTLDRPDVSGPAEVRNAAISFTDVPNGLSSVEGFLQFQHNRLVIERLAAQSGGGKLDVHGFITYANGLLFDLTAHSSEMRLRYPAGISAIASMDLRYAGSIPNSRLSGTVTITRFALNSRFDFAQYLASSKQPESVPQPDSPLSNLHLDVHIVSASELQMQTSSAHLLGNVDLRLRGTAAHPVLLGRVNVLEGDITIAGTKYHIDRGDVTFSNPTRIEPVLNVEATARIRDYDVSLGVHGVPPDHLRSSYRSDPPLPESDVIALLALGRTNDESRLNPQPTQNYTETASNAILGEALNETVSSRAQKLFGLGRIKIDPQAGGPESNPNARLTIEQQVSDKVTLTYITNLSQSAQQIIQVEYNVDRNFTIIAVRDQNGVLGFDVRYRRRKR